MEQVSNKAVLVSQHDFILLDRSGSMEGSMWKEALGAINGYVKKLAEDKVDTHITLACFDTNNPFEILRSNATPENWKPLSNDDAMPRGGTPLNDATGKLLDLAEKGDKTGKQFDKVAIIIMTDGMENSSQEYTTDKIKARLARAKEKDWAVTFLGANFDNVSQAAGYGASLGQSVNSTMRNMRATMDTMASKRGLYSSGAVGQSAGSMSWTPDEQDEAKKQ